MFPNELKKKKVCIQPKHKIFYIGKKVFQFVAKECTLFSFICNFKGEQIRKKMTYFRQQKSTVWVIKIKRKAIIFC